MHTLLTEHFVDRYEPRRNPSSTCDELTSWTPDEFGILLALVLLDNRIREQRVQFDSAGGSHGKRSSKALYQQKKCRSYPCQHVAYKRCEPADYPKLLACANCLSLFTSTSSWIYR
jgi:hypothetical protein